MPPILWHDLRYPYGDGRNSSASRARLPSPVRIAQTVMTHRKMEREGLCESEWDISEEGVPTRRTYSVTEAGEEYLAAWVEGCKRYQNVMDCLYRAYTSSR
jgi:hypothetical protein